MRNNARKKIMERLLLRVQVKRQHIILHPVKIFKIEDKMKTSSDI